MYKQNILLEFHIPHEKFVSMLWNIEFDTTLKFQELVDFRDRKFFQPTPIIVSFNTLVLS